MSPARLAAALALLFPSLVPACAGKVVDTKSACADSAAATCERLQECEPVGWHESWADMGECTADYGASCVAGMGVKGLGFSSRFIESCANATSAASCDQFVHHGVSACVAPAGTLPDGAACSKSAQCKGRLCALTPPTTPGGTYTCGVCAEKRADAHCFSAVECAGGQVCSFGECVAPLAEGATCQLGPAATCQGSTVCVGAISQSTGLCSRPAAVGEACTGDDCASGLTCSGAGSTCEAPIWVSAGGACEFGPNARLCVGSDCIGGRCVARLSAGRACDASGATGYCASGLRCQNGACAGYVDLVCN